MATPAIETATGINAMDFVDDVEGLVRLHQRDLFSIPQVQAEAFRLAALQRRFSEQRDRIGALRKLADIQQVYRIGALDDVVPVLFQHTVYKSYPMQFLEQGKFGPLTRWLDQLSVHDLAGIDVSGCRFIDDWLHALDERTPVRAIHTTGTTGKLSIIPRGRHEIAINMRNSAAKYQGFGNEPDMGFDPDTPGERLPIVHPTYRHGFYASQRVLDLQIETYSGEDICEALYDEWMSADVLSLAGRVMSAEARGELDKLRIDPALLERFRTDQQRRRHRADDDARFFDRVLERFGGKRVQIGATSPMVFAWAQEGQRRGLKGIFASNSLIGSGGGNKGTALPDNWREVIEEVVGAPIRVGYGMSELVAASPCCGHGNYHVPAYLLPFVLDEETSEPLPRRGRQTGRAAFHDLAIDSYWAGFITGDEITIDWDGGCACGRQGEFILPQIRRFSEKTGAEDKISCAGASDAHDIAMNYLLQAASQ